MNDLIQHFIPIISLALLAAGWMYVQILAKRMKVKNHIDQTSGCCGACTEKKCTKDSLNYGKQVK
jgi:hypothetical protein